MDHTTQTALRCIIGGLQVAGVLSDEQVGCIVEQLRQSAATSSDNDEQDEADQLRELADDMEADTRLD
jgi:hypothetical protein